MHVALPYPFRASSLTALGADYSSRRLIASFRKYGYDLTFEILGAGGGQAKSGTGTPSEPDPRDKAAKMAIQQTASACYWDLLHDVRPAADPRRHFYLRSTLNRHFPIVQTHHALNYPFYLDSYFVPLLLAESQPFDAVVCHSRASRQAFSNLLSICAEGLARLSGRRPPRFKAQLPIIPNGVDTEQFRPRDRRAVRQELGLPEDVFMILWLGRLSRATKADLLPLFYAYAELRERNPHREMLLLLVGTDGEGYGKILEASAKALGLESGIQLKRVRPADPIYLWYSAADAFVSPVDNVQETFGNTVIEAMAAGVPQVVSDWNGYRDIVVHAETGFRVRTFWASCDDDAVDRWAAWGDWRGAQELLAQTVACDLGEMVSYLERLLHSSELRRTMSAASRKRALAEFDWPVIVGRYVDCWKDLLERCKFAGRAPVQPQSILPDFSRAFAGYASQGLTANTRLRAQPTTGRANCNALEVLNGLQTIDPHHSGKTDRRLTDGLREVLSLTADAEESITLGDLIVAVASDDYSPGDVTRLVLRALKYGLLEVLADDWVRPGVGGGALDPNAAVAQRVR